MEVADAYRDWDASREVHHPMRRRLMFFALLLVAGNAAARTIAVRKVSDAVQSSRAAAADRRGLLPECTGTLSRQGNKLNWAEEREACEKQGIAVSVEQNP